MYNRSRKFKAPKYRRQFPKNFQRALFTASLRWSVRESGNHFAVGTNVLLFEAAATPSSFRMSTQSVVTSCRLSVRPCVCVRRFGVVDIDRLNAGEPVRFSRKETKTTRHRTSYRNGRLLPADYRARVFFLFHIALPLLPLHGYRTVGTKSIWPRSIYIYICIPLSRAFSNSAAKYCVGPAAYDGHTRTRITRTVVVRYTDGAAALRVFSRRLIFRRR